MQDNHISNAINTYLEAFEFKIAYPDEIRGLPTGLKNFDRKIDGIKPGEVILVGGRPAMGKTAFAVNIAYNMALHFSDLSKIDPSDTKCVLYFNLESSSQQMIERFIAVNSGVSLYSLKKHLDSLSVQEAARKSCLNLEHMPIYFSNKAYDVEEIKEEIQKTNAQKEVGCAIIDYLQLTGRRTYREDYTEFLEQVKELAVKLNIPFIILTQLTRDVENRPSKIPMTSDIRGYNKKQDAADKIILLYRESYYFANQYPIKRKRETDEHFQKRCAEWYEWDEKVKSKCTILISKNSNGPTGYGEVKFDSGSGKFDDLDEYCWC